MKFENSDNLLRQEKEIGQYLKLEKENLKLELQASTRRLNDKTDELLSQRSEMKAKEEIVKQEFESTRTTIDDLEKELRQHRTKLGEVEEKRKAAKEELSDLKVDYYSVKAKLEQGMKEN